MSQSPETSPSPALARQHAARARAALTKLMGKHPAVAADLAHVLDIVVELESVLLHLTATAPSTPKFARERRTLEDYSIEPGAEDARAEMLAERRNNRSGSVLRASMEAFERTVAALSAAARPLSFDDLLAEARRIGEMIDGYQVRVALRFLQSLNPPLVLRRQAKYTAAHKGTLKKDARLAWEQLRDQPRVRKASEGR